MASVRRSSMPLSAWSPMSTVPPSPANPTTVTSGVPWASRAARSPEMVAPVVSNAQSIMGTLSADPGKGPDMTAQQQAGIATIVRGPSPLRRDLIASVAAQPGQARGPGLIHSSRGIVSLATDVHLRRVCVLPKIHPFDLRTAFLEQGPKHPLDCRRGHIPPADPGDEPLHPGTDGRVVQGAAHLRERGTRRAVRERSIHNPDSGRVPCEFPKLFDGERPERAELRETHGVSLLAHPVNDVFRRAGDRAHSDEDRVRALPTIPGQG